MLLISTQSWAACIRGNCVNGQGTATFAGGGKYVGEWKDGKRHGQGTMTFANGGVKAGIWENGEYVGTVAE